MSCETRCVWSELWWTEWKRICKTRRNAEKLYEPLFLRNPARTVRGKPSVGSGDGGRTRRGVRTFTAIASCMIALAILRTNEKEETSEKTNGPRICYWIG